MSGDIGTTDGLEAGSGSGSSKRSGLLTLSANQTTNLDVNDPIQFDQQESGGDLDFDAVNFRITLRAGVRVRIEAALFCGFGGSSGRADFRFYDVTNAAFVGQTGILYPTSGGGDESTQANAFAYLIPATDIVVELRVTTDVVWSNVQTAFCWLFCQEL